MVSVQTIIFPITEENHMKELHVYMTTQPSNDPKPKPKPPIQEDEDHHGSGPQQ